MNVLHHVLVHSLMPAEHLEHFMSPYLHISDIIKPLIFADFDILSLSSIEVHLEIVNKISLLIDLVIFGDLFLSLHCELLEELFFGLLFDYL